MIVYVMAFLTGVALGGIAAALVYHNNLREAQDLISQLQGLAKKV